MMVKKVAIDILSQLAVVIGECGDAQSSSSSHIITGGMFFIMLIMCVMKYSTTGQRSFPWIA